MIIYNVPMSVILDKFLRENKQKTIKLFLATGFQLVGKLLNYDEQHLVLQTMAYNKKGDDVPKDVVISFHNISTYLPSFP